jgi:hypothetical protein
MIFNCSTPIFQESTVISYGGESHLDTDYRLSWTANLNQLPIPEEHDADYDVIKCIENRASVFQGHVPVENIEELQVVK